jgi:hypothetical protein
LCENTPHIRCIPTQTIRGKRANSMTNYLEDLVNNEVVVFKQLKCIYDEWHQIFEGDRISKQKNDHNFGVFNWIEYNITRVASTQIMYFFVLLNVLEKKTWSPLF